jgi:hypothetical protein
MKKDNWRFEALARAKIVRQEEEGKYICECGEVYFSTFPYKTLSCLKCGKPIRREG